jgi:hypothetical protein
MGRQLPYDPCLGNALWSLAFLREMGPLGAACSLLLHSAQIGALKDWGHYSLPSRILHVSFQLFPHLVVMVVVVAGTHRQMSATGDHPPMHLH